MECVFSFIIKINDNIAEKTIKFINVKLYGGKLNTLIAPRKKGPKKTTKNLFFNKFIMHTYFIMNLLNLKFFFRLYSFSNSFYLLYGYNLSNVIGHAPTLYRIPVKNCFF